MIASDIVYIDRLIASSECDAIVKDAQGQGWSAATIGGGSSNQVVSAETRDSDILWLPHDHTLQPIIAAAIDDANRTQYGYDLDGSESPQLSRYRAGGHYRWHVDQLPLPPPAPVATVGDRRCRKLSIIIMLSDPARYLGGETLMQDTYGGVLAGYARGEDWRAQGSALVFPATLFHCVMPVQAGVRYSLAQWFTGPAWR